MLVDYFIIKSPKDLTPNRFIKELKTSDMKIDIYEYSIGNTEEISSKLNIESEIKYCIVSPILAVFSEVASVFASFVKS